MIAVITGDLIDSSLYKKELLEEVLNTLKKEFKNIEEDFRSSNLQFKIYRGDSFQGVVEHPEKALRISLQIKTAINRIPINNPQKNNANLKLADFRMAIGIGSFDFERDSIAESNGQAFQFSGRTLDEMKSLHRKIRLKTPQEEVNSEFNTSFFLLDMLTDKWSSASAEVVYYLLKGLKEREIASELNISQSAVNQRKKTAGWEATAVLLNRYEEVTYKYFSNGK